MGIQKKLLVLVLGWLLPTIALAATGGQIEGGLGSTGREAGYPLATKGAAPKVDFANAFLNYVNGTTVLVGVLFFIRILYGGWLWMSARGNEDQVTRAKGMILHAVIAMAIIISARMIVELVVIVVSPLATQQAS